MREIKFRFWFEHLNKMSEGYHLEYILHHQNDYNPHKTIPLPLQFTGLKDKNGKEIYEGDVIQKKQGDQTFRYDVQFYFGAFGIEFPPPSYAFKPFIELHMNNYEVIGNIYENPELLK